MNDCEQIWGMLVSPVAETLKKNGQLLLLQTLADSHLPVLAENGLPVYF